MGISKEQRAALDVAIGDLVNCEVADSWKGGGDPADIPAIEAELELARIKLITLLDKLEREEA